MLVRLLYFLLGSVKFTFTGGFPDDFINECYNNNINIKNIIYIDNAITAEAGIKSYKRLHRIAYSCGGKTKIIKKSGLPFILSPLKNRWGICAGALFFVLFTSFMSGFIWNITVTGSDVLSQARVVDYLAKNGFTVGTRWANTDKENLEFQIMADFDEVAWVSINQIGCLAQIEIYDSVEKPEIINDDIITNVTAKCDGVIVHITALGGIQQAKNGDAVAKGDLLISGVYESEVDKQNHYMHAHGRAIAKTQRELTVYIGREQTEKNYYAVREYKTLYFFGMEIPLYIKKETENADEKTEKAYLAINSFRLPIGIIKEKYDYFKPEKKTLNDEELEALARQELERKKEQELAECEIISEDIKISSDENGCTLTAEYSVLEDIAQETEIKIIN